MPQYAVLMYERVPPEELPPEVMAAHQAHPARVAEAGGRVVAGLALHAASTATSIRDGLLTDGPFIETKEDMAGLVVLEARDLDHALELAKLTPIVDGGVEVRPLLGFEVVEAELKAIEQAVAEAHRREWAYVLAATVRVTRDFDAAEDCVQEAYVAALKAWARDGVPERPGAWLTTAARRNALNALARRKSLQAKLPLLLEPEPTAVPEPTAIPDDRLRLVFTCCHPALAPEAQVALTLRLVCGVATPDIAHAFLVAEPTMAARLTRAKKKIAAASIPYVVPGPADLPARLDAVLTVVHLLSTTGHTAPSGDALVRVDLADRALDLARMLHLLLPAESEVDGLLALLLVHHARAATRTDAAGRLARLPDQDRTAWDRPAIAEADRLIVAALRAAPAGRFTIQAAIAALHAQAPSYDDTDWPQILTLYDALLRVWPSPVAALNRAVAVAMVDGPQTALEAVEALERDGRLDGYRYLPATKADLLRRLGRHAEAGEAYRAALALTDNSAERAFLAERLAG